MAGNRQRFIERQTAAAQPRREVLAFDKLHDQHGTSIGVSRDPIDLATWE